MGELLRYLIGYVDVEISGAHLSQLVRDFSRLGLRVRGLRYDGKKVRVEVPAGALWRMRPMIRQARARVRVRRRVGLPFWWRAACRRPVLLVGIALAFVAYLVAASLVWTVEVDGAGPLAPRVFAVAQADGVRPLALLSGIDSRGVSKDILKNIPGVVHAGVHLDGTLVRIRVVRELTPPPPADLGATKTLVALDSGLVVRVVTLQGRALVGRGDTVVRGQVLIAPGGEGGSQARASGMVYARVWHRVEVRQPLERSLTIATGRSATGFGILVGGRAVLRRTAPYHQYRVTASEWRIPWLPVEVVTYRYTEVRRMVVSLTPKLAQDLARRRGLDRIKGTLPKDAQVLAVRSSDRSAGRDLDLTVTVEAEENIASRP